MEKRIKETILKVIDKLPEEYKFEFKDIQKNEDIYTIKLISPEKKGCEIILKSGKFDKTTDQEFIGLFAHELAHNWVCDIKQTEDINKAIKINTYAQYYQEKGEYRRAQKLMNEAMKLHKIKKNKEFIRLEEEYIKNDKDTDDFAKEKFGLKEEIEALRKVSREYRLNAEFKKYVN